MSDLTVRDAVPTVLVGLFAGVAAVAGSYAAAGYTAGFVVQPVTVWLTATVPDAVLTFVIQEFGDLGQQLNLLGAIALVVTAVAAITVAGRLAGRALNNRAVPVTATTVGTWAATALLTGEPVLALAAGLPAGAAVAFGVATPRFPPLDAVDTERRNVLASGLSVAGIGVVGYLFGQRRTPEIGGERLNEPDGAGTRQELLFEGRQRGFDLDGAEPLVSENHYTVDINTVSPTVDDEEWSLSVTGSVESELTVDYEDLREMEAVDRFETIRCVGESLNGKKMDTALWTGVPVMDIVEEAGPDSDCECVMLHAVDDYYVQFPIDALDEGLLAYGMNNRVLPREHGYPVRALVPGHWGEVQVKWISEIELLDEAVDGYWEERGWQGTGPVETVAKLHSQTELSDGRMELGGHAYAGTRGIQQVEVSVDGGETWAEAELSDPLPAAEGEEPLDAWRQWRYRYDPPEGSHEVVVRATDGTGTLQPRTESDSFPSGATGWVSRTIE